MTQGNVLPFGHRPHGERGVAIVALARRQLPAPADDIFSAELAELVPALESRELSSVCGLMALRLDSGS